jgi:putative transposase
MAWRVLRREPRRALVGGEPQARPAVVREEGLRRPVRSRKRRRVVPEQAERLRAERPNQVWAIDFQFDETADGRRVKLANIVDEHTREALSMRVGRTCTADALVEVLAGLEAARGTPEHLRMDNGPELLAWALRDWCRLSGTRTSYIEPGAPWENPYVESFNGRVRDELLNLKEFTSLTVAQVLVEAWRIEYNTCRPHSALGGLTPRSTRPPGPAPINPHSHSEWTNNRGPVSPASTCSSERLLACLAGELDQIVQTLALHTVERDDIPHISRGRRSPGQSRCGRPSRRISPGAQPLARSSAGQARRRSGR